MSSETRSSKLIVGLRYVTIALLLACVAVLLSVGFLLWRFRQDQGLATDMMDRTIREISIGDTMSDVEEVVARANSAIDSETGSYRLGSYWINPDAPVDNSLVVVKGYGLRSGIVCYTNLAMDEDRVSEIGTVECEGDGWIG